VVKFEVMNGNKNKNALLYQSSITRQIGQNRGLKFIF